MPADPGGRYEIGRARPAEVPRLEGVERAAATLLRGEMPDELLDRVTDPLRLNAAQRRGRLWVARDGAEPVGFALVELLESEVAHLAELAVHPDHGRRGVGRRLVRAVCAWASATGYGGVTLTTFRDLPWNGPFYARMGFEALDDEEVSPAVRAALDVEVLEGIDPRRRIAMRWPVTLTLLTTPAHALISEDR